MTRNQLIEENMNLVYGVIKKEFPEYLHDEDLVQVGMVALCVAADRWDSSRCKFAHFAYSCIKNAILTEFRSRNKHRGVWSLDYEVTQSSGEKTPFSEIIAGDEDVLYIDCCEQHLNPLQKRVVELLKRGLSGNEVAETLGVTHQYVSWTKRKIRILRSMDTRKG